MNDGDVRELPIAVDFDGVIAESVWPDRGIGPLIEDNIRKLRLLAKAGYRIVVHTARPWSDRDVLEKWLLANQVPFDDINCGKFLALRYIDDRALNSAAESWL